MTTVAKVTADASAVAPPRHVMEAAKAVDRLHDVLSRAGLDKLAEAVHEGGTKAAVRGEVYAYGLEAAVLIGMLEEARVR